MGHEVLSQARAAFFTAPRTIEVRPITIEKPGEPGELLVRSRLMGISAGSELLFYRGTFPRGIEGDLPGHDRTLEYPLAYGYSNAGVDENGRRVFAFRPHQDLFYAPEEELIPLPGEVGDEDAVFLPNLETALGIAQELRPIPGEIVAVVGLGVVGTLVTEILCRCHYGTIVTFDTRSSRKAAAESLGAVFIDPSTRGWKDEVMSLTEGRGIDRGVNTSGSEHGLQALVDTAAPESELIEASWYGDREVSLSLGRQFHRKRLGIRSFQVSGIGSGLRARWTKARRMALVLELLAVIKPGRHITHRFPLGEIRSAFELLDSGAEDVLQVVLYP